MAKDCHRVSSRGGRQAAALPPSDTEVLDEADLQEPGTVSNGMLYVTDYSK